MDGLVYLLNQAGIALAQLEQRNAELESEIQSLRAEAQGKVDQKNG
jgi:uncharacterized small protein (DUF1192 family)